ncbi:hypothetical protein D9613_012397 [Agrocybe pediades]|uniref:Uncharacterized protein n=1 Tax=Agrocybe pediades TaxID=84607 RepID=A0A8H4QRB6_9AGAR|nr:hypothetical protein D9613_012397 [Agrocybe pediades]
MGSVHDTISRSTSNITRNILQLALDDRQILTALLRWDPNVSDRLTRALQSVDLPWQRLSFEEEYAFILRDLESSIQQAPLILAEVATINIRLDGLGARISQVAPGSHSLMGHVAGRNSTETSGIFTINSQNAPADGLTTTESDQENIFYPLRRVLAGIKRVIMGITHKLDGADSAVAPPSPFTSFSERGLWYFAALRCTTNPPSAPPSRSRSGSSISSSLSRRAAMNPTNFHATTAHRSSSPLSFSGLKSCPPSKVSYQKHSAISGVCVLPLLSASTLAASSSSLDHLRATTAIAAKLRAYWWCMEIEHGKWEWDGEHETDAGFLAGARRDLEEVQRRMEEDNDCAIRMVQQRREVELGSATVVAGGVQESGMDRVNWA